MRCTFYQHVDKDFKNTYLIFEKMKGKSTHIRWYSDILPVKSVKKKLS